MRLIATILTALVAMLAHAERILLIPLDSRPAAGQFAQMIAKIASVDVFMPPYDALGRFTKPGSSEEVLDWLNKQDLSDVQTVIASADMVAYGGLIASRTGQTTSDKALARLARLGRIVRRSPKTRLFVFSATMRLAPTATKQAAAWRMKVAKFAEVRERVQRGDAPGGAATLARLRKEIPDGELSNYYAVRRRDERIQAALIDMVAKKQVDYLIVGQDDAKPYGPHISERKRLIRRVAQRGVGRSVYFCEGIDQHANVLLSRALLLEDGYSPLVRVVYSDPEACGRTPDFESRPLEESLRDQLVASGARLADPKLDETPGYTMFVNVPTPRETEFAGFLQNLANSVDAKLPVAVADINLDGNGMSDPKLFEGLWTNSRVMRLLSYAGWNTAGNTLGTTIPAANVVMLARRRNKDPLGREIAQRKFLLHRVVDDYAYHRFVRPQAYNRIDSKALESTEASREETYGLSMREIDSYVRQQLRMRLDSLFREGVRGQRFSDGTENYEISSLSDVRIWLPWPRAYEMRLEFKLEAKPLSPPSSTNRP
jgi:hypothetical protein